MNVSGGYGFDSLRITYGPNPRPGQLETLGSLRGGGHHTDGGEREGSLVAVKIMKRTRLDVGKNIRFSEVKIWRS